VKQPLEVVAQAKENDNQLQPGDVANELPEVNQKPDNNDKEPVKLYELGMLMNETTITENNHSKMHIYVTGDFLSEEQCKKT